MNETPPRTDKNTPPRTLEALVPYSEICEHGNDAPTNYVSADFAAELERENAAYRNALIDCYKIAELYSRDADPKSERAQQIQNAIEVLSKYPA